MSELEIMGEVPKLWIDLALYHYDIWRVSPVPSWDACIARLKMCVGYQERLLLGLL